jgi:two-component system, chemotaxis family, protein-glutamate methylesterase/glutaminase
MLGHEVTTIGASAGGVEALIDLVRGLPADLPASIFVVLHMASHGSSVLPRILSRRGPLPTHHARDGETIVLGRIYVAPPDHHLLIHQGLIRLSRGPRENGFRPAIDPLFRTAAQSYGPRVVGVVLSGMLDDGSAGLLAIKERCGIAVVQDPDDALFPEMPRNAMDIAPVDHVLPASGIANLLNQLARDDSAVKGGGPMPDDRELEPEMAGFDLDAIQGDDWPGPPSEFAGPDGAGVLWKIQDGEMIHDRGPVGHSWSPTRLLSEPSNSLTKSLGMAFRTLEERSAVIRQGLVNAEDPAAEMPATPGQEGQPG